MFPWLHEDWKLILRHAWSVRLIVLAALLSGAEVLLPIIQPYLPVPPGVFAGLSFMATVAAFSARFMAQKQFMVPNAVE